MGIAAKSDLKALKFTTIETKGNRTKSSVLTVEHSYFNSSLLFLSVPFRQNPTEHFKCKIWSAVFPAVPPLPPPPTNDCYLCYDHSADQLKQIQTLDFFAEVNSFERDSTPRPQ